MYFKSALLVLVSVLSRFAIAQSVTSSTSVAQSSSGASSTLSSVVSPSSLAASKPTSSKTTSVKTTSSKSTTSKTTTPKTTSTTTTKSTTSTTRVSTSSKTSPTSTSSTLSSKVSTSKTSTTTSKTSTSTSSKSTTSKITSSKTTTSKTTTSKTTSSKTSTASTASTPSSSSTLSSSTASPIYSSSFVFTSSSVSTSPPEPTYTSSSTVTIQYTSSTFTPSIGTSSSVSLSLATSTPLTSSAFSLSSTSTVSSTSSSSLASPSSTISTNGGPQPTNVPPNVTAVNVLGLTSDNPFNSAIYRDGGGGGYVNGYHVISFSDTFTTKEPGAENDSFTSFRHNTFAYFGYRNASDPTNLFDFGSTPQADGNRTFLTAPFIAVGNETTTPYTTVSVWPNSNMVSYDATHGLAVYTCYNETALNAFYNTMVILNVTSPLSPSVSPGHNLGGQRIVLRLFYATENMYGSFGIYKYSGAVSEPSDGYLYLFSTSSYGIKMARVPAAQMTDRTQYTYFNGTAWDTNQPAISDSLASIIQWNYTNPFNNLIYGPGSGDIFWSPYFSTYICIFIGDGILSDFFISYSTTATLEGPWTVPETVYETPQFSECATYGISLALNYAGHAYPSWDASGKTVLLSYSSCDAWVSMVSVTWE